VSSSEERKARSFVERHGLWNDEQFEAAALADKRIEDDGLDTVRLSFPDQHGILRGKSVMAGEAAAVMRNGCSMTTTLLAKDTAHKTAFPVFTPGGGFGMAEMEGGGDFLMIADPATFRVLPWAPQTGWVLCDIYFPNGKPVPFSTRNLYRRTLQQVIAIYWAFHAASAAVGVLQIYFPDQLTPMVSTAISSRGDWYVEDLKIALVNGERVFRPMGLSTSAEILRLPICLPWIRSNHKAAISMGFLQSYPATSARCFHSAISAIQVSIH